MATYLNGSAGTGEYIMKNMDFFSYDFKKSDSISNGTMYSFDWIFNTQSGYISIVVSPEGTIDPSSLIHCTKNQNYFQRPLGLYNDNSLFSIFEKMLKSIDK